MKPAALIHAGSMTEEDRLDATTIARLNKGIELLENRETEHLVLAAGCGSKARFDPEGIEIRVGYSTRNMTHDMAAYLAGNGVPARYVLAAPWGRDTIGEVYFAEQQVFSPRGYKEVLAVTSEWHSQRTQIIHEQIRGPSKRTHMIRVRTLLDCLPGVSVTERNEQTRLRRFFQDFGDVTPGDLRGIEEKLYTRHDLYKALPESKRVKFYD